MNNKLKFKIHTKTIASRLAGAVGVICKSKFNFLKKYLRSFTTFLLLFFIRYQSGDLPIQTKAVKIVNKAEWHSNPTVFYNNLKSLTSQKKV